MSLLGKIAGKVAGYAAARVVSSDRAISYGPMPDMVRANIRLTTAAASGSTNHLFLSFGSLIYPYGTLLVSGFPDFPLLPNTAFSFFDVSRA